MEIYAAQYRFRRDYDFDFPISTLIWGAVIFVALVAAACLLVGKAIPRLRNRKETRQAERWREDTRRTPTLPKHWQKYGTRKIGLSRAPVSSVRRWNAGRRVRKRKGTRTSHRR